MPRKLYTLSLSSTTPYYIVMMMCCVIVVQLIGLSERCQSIEEELAVINNKLSYESYQVTCVYVCVCVCVCVRAHTRARVCMYCVPCNVNFDLRNCTHVFFMS